MAEQRRNRDNRNNGDSGAKGGDDTGRHRLVDHLRKNAHAQLAEAAALEQQLRKEDEERAKEKRGRFRIIRGGAFLVPFTFLWEPIRRLISMTAGHPLPTALVGSATALTVVGATVASLAIGGGREARSPGSASARPTATAEAAASARPSPGLPAPETGDPVGQPRPPAYDTPTDRAGPAPEPPETPGSGPTIAPAPLPLPTALPTQPRPPGPPLPSAAPPTGLPTGDCIARAKILGLDLGLVCGRH